MRWAQAIVMVLAAMMLIPCGAWGKAGIAHADEFAVIDVKALLISKITEFLEWPAGASLAKKETVFSLVFLGSDALYARARSLYAERTIQGHRVSVRRAEHVQDIGAPHILFVGATQQAELPRVLLQVEGRPVLIMGDSPGFAERGGGINLALENKRVRFEVNRNALRKAKIQVSFRLFAVAKVVGASP